MRPIDPMDKSVLAFKGGLYAYAISNKLSFDVPCIFTHRQKLQNGLVYMFVRTVKTLILLMNRNIRVKHFKPLYTGNAITDRTRHFFGSTSRLR